ncbi:MAG: phenylalanine--tRNA ligase subunit alpha [Anaerolineales bacterium]|nr:phenylalanine--tRNA ligase subunit alpha [Anaerolineales bacterium]
MQQKLNQLEQQALAELEQVTSQENLQAWKVKYLGRSAKLADITKNLKDVPREERPQVGRRANEVKQALEGSYQKRLENLQDAAMIQNLEKDRLDVTLPGRPVQPGRLHPTTRTHREIYAIWAEMGFQMYRSREVESDDYNFTYMNMPPHHPARDMWDTFYTKQEGVILRTHTSPGQMRVMRERAPEPIRVIVPGMCYRYEQISARSEIQFNQIEGLAVGEKITFSDLKGTLNSFARRFFHQGVRTRFRANHFPFTEPSAEMDVECFVCGGEGCSVCKGTGWLEILGCGMVHPTVLKYGGYDPEKYSGFAFGMGPERITMLKYRIPDIRYFWANDLRFLQQF